MSFRSPPIPGKKNEVDIFLVAVIGARIPVDGIKSIRDRCPIRPLTKGGFAEHFCFLYPCSIDHLGEDFAKVFALGQTKHVPGSRNDLLQAFKIFLL